MPKNIDLVRDFHMKFDVPISVTPKLLTTNEQQFRFDFMQEEVNEFDSAWMQGDIVGCFDALIDLEYVVHGTALMMGLPTFRGFRIVHACNMLKQKGGPRHASDVSKPPGWVGPETQLMQLLRRRGYRP